MCAAGLDYSDTTESVTVSSTPFTDCTTIPIQLDSVVENTEQFFAVLTSTDPAVQVTQDATVEILDVSGIFELTLIHKDLSGRT